jgi:hypothetical protein
MDNKRFSFEKGWENRKSKDTEAIMSEIMEALGITSRFGWKIRLLGRVEPKVTEVERIEAVFAKYGISDIWGAADETEVETNKDK